MSDEFYMIISMWITVGLIISTLGVASLGAYFSIVGLAALFSGAVVAVCLMAGMLEFAKFMLAAYLHETWKSLNLVYKSYLTFAIVVLSIITSVGIFGFLSDAYQSASLVLEAETIKTESIKSQQALVTAEITRLNKMVEEIPDKRISRRLKMRAEVEPQIIELNKKVTAGEKLLTESNLKLVDVKRKVGPLIYIAKATNLNIDKVVSYLILILVSVFDPLAICLVIATTNSIASRKNAVERPENNEVEAEQKTSTLANKVSEVMRPIVMTEAAPVVEEDIIVQMNFKDESENKKAV